MYIFTDMKVYKLFAVFIDLPIDDGLHLLVKLSSIVGQPVGIYIGKGSILIL